MRLFLELKDVRLEGRNYFSQATTYVKKSSYQHQQHERVRKIVDALLGYPSCVTEARRLFENGKYRESVFGKESSTLLEGLLILGASAQHSCTDHSHYCT